MSRRQLARLALPPLSSLGGTTATVQTLLSGRDHAASAVRDLSTASPVSVFPATSWTRHRGTKGKITPQQAARETSFWSHSYPPISSDFDESPRVYSPLATEHSPSIPYAPPFPSASLSSVPPAVKSRSEGGDGVSAPLVPPEGKKKERKQRYLDSLMDKAGELNLRCSVLDANGSWTLQEGRFKKAELCKEYDLDPRDLRKLDSLAPNLVPVILTRRTCILMSILHVRALIKPDKVIIFDTLGTVESEAQRRFKLHLERNVRAGQSCSIEGQGMESTADPGSAVNHSEEDDQDLLPYEHRALESILVATANALEEEMAYTRSLVQELLSDLEDDINRDNLKRLLHYSRRMVGFQSRARYVKRAVDEILDNDEDLSAMYLTSASLGRPRALHDHEQLELLLESFTKQVEEIVSEIDNTVANIQSTQEIAELMLDSGRNALLALDIKLSIATLGAGCAALVAGLFGMNLTSHLESSPIAFYIATGSAAGFGVLIFLFGLKTLRRVRRVALSDSAGRRGYGARGLAISLAPKWEHLPPVDPLTGAPRAQMGPDLVRRVKAADKRMIWDMISRRSASASASRMRNAQSRETSQGSGQQAQSRSMMRYFGWRSRGGDRAAGDTGGLTEPVWINSDADRARARDAWVAQMHARSLAAKARRGASGLEGPEAQLAEGEGMSGHWETGPWKWGRGKAKWAKD